MVTRFCRCGAQIDEGPTIQGECVISRCSSFETIPICQLHFNSFRKSEEYLDELKTELEAQINSFKRERKLWSEERIKLIQERDDKVYLVQEKLTN